MKRLELLLPPPLIMLITGLIMWLVARLFPLVSFDWIRSPLLSTLLVLLGLVVGLSGIASFVRSKTTANPKQPSETSKLVRTGVYRYSRNPMYLGMLCFLISWGIYLSNILSIVCITIYIAYITRFQIMPEERVLHEKFQEDFISYKNKVRRWL